MIVLRVNSFATISNSHKCGKGYTRFLRNRYDRRSRMNHRGWLYKIIHKRRTISLDTKFDPSLFDGSIAEIHPFHSTMSRSGHTHICGIDSLCGYSSRRELQIRRLQLFH